LEQIITYLRNIHNLFCNPYFDDSVKQSLKFIHKELKNKNLDDFDVEEDRQLSDQMKRDEEFEIFLNQSKLFIELDYEKSIKENSPFSNLFNKNIVNFALEINNKLEANKKIFKNNIFYSNDLFKILWEQLYIIPIWSGLIIFNQPMTYKVKTRLSNNPVENYFSIVKNKILNKKKNLATSEIVSAFFKYSYARYLKYFNSDKNNNTNSAKMHQEIWTDKNKKLKKNKSFYFENFDIYKLKLLGTNEEMETEQIESDQMDNDQMETNENQPKQTLIENREKICQFKNLLTYIEQKSISFNNVKKKFFEMKNTLDEFVLFLRNIHKFTEFKGQEIYDEFKKILNLNEDLYPVYNSSNGNCLYNSISILLFGNEDFFFIIKICSIFILFEYEFFFKHVIHAFDREVTFEKFILNTCRKNEFGEILNILSISILLNKTVFNFIESKKKDENVKWIFSLRSNDFQRVLIGCFNSHFFPILTNKNEIVLKKCIDINDFNFEDRFVNLEILNKDS
jgi:hypothetical protein